MTDDDPGICLFCDEGTVTLYNYSYTTFASLNFRNNVTTVNGTSLNLNWIRNDVDKVVSSAIDPTSQVNDHA